MTEAEQTPGATSLKHRWEERASMKGTTLSSVLYRGFAEPLNRYVHDWHVAAVTTHLLPRLACGARVLDLGCGYGRIRDPVAAARPDLQIVGLDFSENYCRMYASSRNTPTVCADVNRIPFAPASFDAIMGVTSLMYIERELRGERIARILETLKPQGHALFVDPGLEFMKLVRLGLRSTSKTPTGGLGFLLREYETLGSGKSHRVYGVGGMPTFTALLPALYAASRSSAATSHLLRIARHFDFGTQRLTRYSLQRWVLLGPR